MSVPFTNLKEVTTSEGDEVEYTPPANTLSKHNCSWEALTCCVVVVILLIMFVPIAIIIAVDVCKSFFFYNYIILLYMNLCT